MDLNRDSSQTTRQESATGSSRNHSNWSSDQAQGGTSSSSSNLAPTSNQLACRPTVKTFHGGESRGGAALGASVLDFVLGLTDPRSEARNDLGEDAGCDVLSVRRSSRPLERRVLRLA